MNRIIHGEHIWLGAELVLFADLKKYYILHIIYYFILPMYILFLYY